MIGVITHEIGHNFFPMIVNSDERQWTWMDEGLNSFIETLTELAFDKDFNTENLPKDIVSYMAGDQSNIAPIMTQGDQVYQFGPNAYSKPAAGLYLLRETILGHKLFDYAFRTYSRRWMFKHPTPEDFFRTMEDASGVDLDWFWRGWFYTTDVCDIAVKEVNQFRVTDKPTKRILSLAKELGIPAERIRPGLFLTTDEISEGEPEKIEDIRLLTSYLEKKYKNKTAPEIPSYVYEIVFEKPGGLVMPIIAEITYEDGRKKRKTYPAQIWQKNDREVRKIISSTKAIKSILIDPDLETADVDTTNNSWPTLKKSVFNLKKEGFKAQQ
jgi:aminopeptidase N